MVGDDEGVAGRTGQRLGGLPGGCGSGCGLHEEWTESASVVLGVEGKEGVQDLGVSLQPILKLLIQRQKIYANIMLSQLV